MKSGTTPDPAELRRRAEQRLQARGSTSIAPLAAHDAQRLVHDLQVHQIELELQNEELRLAQAKVDAAMERYADYHDFSPVSLVSLARDGAIAEVNLTGTRLLGVERSRLIGAHFALFVAQTDKPVFTTLLQNVFAGKSPQSCQVELAIENLPQHSVQIDAALSADGQECRMAITDLSELRQGQMYLRQSQDLLDKLSRYVPGVIYQYRLFPDQHSSFPYASEGIREIYEVSPEDVHDDAAIVLSRLHPEDVDAVVASILESARTMQPWQHEYRVCLPNRGERWLAGHARPEQLADGSTLWHGFITDVTQTKRIDDVLRFLAQSSGAFGQEGFFRPLARYLAKALDAEYICVDRLVDDNLSAATLAVYYDGKFEDNLLYRLQDTPCGDVVGKDVCVFPAGVKDLFPRDLALQQFGAEGYIGVTLWSSDDRPIGLIAAISRQPLVNVRQAESILKLVAIRAGSEMERRQAEEALLESRKNLAEAQRIARLGSWRLDIANERIVWSDEICRIAGLDSAQCPSADSDGQRVFVAESWDRLQAALSHTQLTGSPCELNLEILRTDGSRGWIWLRGESVRDARGATIALRGVTRDITEKKRIDDELDRHRNHLAALVTARTRELVEKTQAAEAANIAKSAFLANMSHEIRTPMNAILGMASLLRRTGITPAQADKLDKIDIASRHLLAVIDDILDISKIEAGKFVIEQVRVDVAALVAEVGTLLAERAHSKGLELVVAAPPLPGILLGDATRIRQALLNYGSNAIKFTESGRISLRAMLEDDYGDSVLVRFEVQDTGIGIDPATKARLFATFEQADNTMTRKYGGTGLGLAITRRLPELMGGTADVESVPDAGSIFWFTARLKKQSGETTAEPGERSEINANGRLHGQAV